jgi:hypothetical protein
LIKGSKNNEEKNMAQTPYNTFLHTLSTVHKTCRS